MLSRLGAATLGVRATGAGMTHRTPQWEGLKHPQSADAFGSAHLLSVLASDRATRARRAADTNLIRLTVSDPELPLELAQR
jgi:hypothetical protein